MILASMLVVLLAAPAVAKVLEGTPGKDKLIGTEKADKLIGKGGNDVLRASEGKDLVLGGRGNDFIKGGENFDEIRSGPGNDEIHTRDGVPDQIDCGAGKDLVLADPVEDGLIDCEKVKEE